MMSETGNQIWPHDQIAADRLTAALVVLAQWGIPPDVQELLVAGNPSRGIRPGALSAALRRHTD